jgi:hypothetical protein
MGNDGAKKTESDFPWKEVLAFLGVIIAAYIGYIGIRAQIEIPIHATQTAEAKPTSVLLDTPTPVSSSTATLSIYPTVTPSNQSFSPLTFCYRTELDSLSFQCARSRTIFDYPTTEVCASWIPSSQYQGSSFKRVWKNLTTGEIFSREDSNTYGCVYWYRKEGLSIGQYELNLFVNDVVVQSGSFTIEK